MDTAPEELMMSVDDGTLMSSCAPPSSAPIPSPTPFVCDGASVTITMYDSWGDGWNGGFLQIGDETPFTLEDGAEGTAELCLVEGECYAVVAAGGSYPSEITFSIGDLGDFNMDTPPEELMMSVDDGTLMSSCAPPSPVPIPSFAPMSFVPTSGMEVGTGVGIAM